MTCCNEKPVLQMDDLQASALGFGFDLSWITDLIGRFGGDVLNLVVEAVRGGFSKELVVDVLEKFGPVVLELLVNLLNKKKMHAMAAAGGLVVGDEVGFFDGAILETLVKKYLPVLMEKYGDQIVDYIVKFIIAQLAK